MVGVDDWGEDPSVRIMRRVFSRIEAVQKKLLDGLKISPYDTRLRPWRETALRLFERSWAQLAKRGPAFGEERAAMIYVHCLAKAIGSDGVEIPGHALPEDEKIEMFIKEIQA
jgi:hypothetical protein